MFDATEAGNHLKPEAAARLREIVRSAMELQAEAADIMHGEAVRLSKDVDEEMEAREAIGTWYGRLAVEGLREAAEDDARPES